MAASMALSRDKRPPQRQNLLLLLPEYTISTAIHLGGSTSGTGLVIEGTNFAEIHKGR